MAAAKNAGTGSASESVRVPPDASTLTGPGYLAAVIAAGDVEALTAIATAADAVASHPDGLVTNRRDVHTAHQALIAALYHL